MSLFGNINMCVHSLVPGAKGTVNQVTETDSILEGIKMERKKKKPSKAAGRMDLFRDCKERLQSQKSLKERDHISSSSILMFCCVYGTFFSSLSLNIMSLRIIYIITCVLFIFNFLYLFLMMNIGEGDVSTRVQVHTEVRGIGSLKPVQHGYREQNSG